MKSFYSLLHWFVVFVAISILIEPTLAQEQKKHRSEAGGKGYFMVGFGKLDLGSLNSRLKAKNYPEFKENYVSLGGGGHAVIGKLIIGGDGEGHITTETTYGNQNNSLEVGYGFFDIGYILLSSKNLQIYPLIGIGGGGIELQIVEKGASEFDDILDNPKRMSKISTGGLLMQFCLGADYLLSFNGNEGSIGGLVFGVRIGYKFTPIKSNWSMENLEISNGPELGITGPFIRIMFGGGGLGREK